MNIAYLTHSLASCWNHGNAHFLRGLLRELGRRGHRCIAWEPEGAWSLDHLVRDHGPGGASGPSPAPFPDLLAGRPTRTPRRPSGSWTAPTW
ncbi:MAG: hypothetical protein R3D25_22685 [Geminicoccaceae bacterium]